MTVAEIQAAIAAAASTVDGVTGHDRKPDSPQEGAAWVVWVESRPFLGGSFDCTWRLFVMLPFEHSAALDRSHVLMDEITFAVQTQIPGSAVERVRPGKLGGENSTPVLTLDVRAAATFGE